jgi:hypothetical protein
VPDDKIGEEAVSVIREAMVKSNTRAISRVVLYHRERAVLLEPRDKGMAAAQRDPQRSRAAISAAPWQPAPEALFHHRHQVDDVAALGAPGFFVLGRARFCLA